MSGRQYVNVAFSLRGVWRECDDPCWGCDLPQVWETLQGIVMAALTCAYRQYGRTEDRPASKHVSKNGTACRETVSICGVAQSSLVLKGIHL